jgi:PAS domain S-box-containing protein
MYTVLYIDDEPALLELGKTFLELSGSITVETALSAKEGIQVLEKTAFDCIISDYQMPLMDGLAFLKFLREKNNWIPFILFTGRGREEVVIEAVNSGVDFYLQKGGEPKSQFVELEHKIRLAIESRRTVNELEESRQRMKDIIDHLPDATFAIDLDGKVIAWNRAMEEMTGVDKNAILGTGDHAYALPFYGTRRSILLDLVLREDKETAQKYPQIIRKDKNLISEIFIPLLYGGKGAHLWFIASPLYDTRGNIVGAIESIRDITDRKKAEEAIRESEKRFRNIVETTNDWIWEVDETGSYTYASPQVLAMLGYPPDELLGKTPFDLMPPKEASRVSQIFSKIFASQQPFSSLENTNLHKDGHTVILDTSGVPVFRPDGTFCGYRGIDRDITERKRQDHILRAQLDLGLALQSVRGLSDTLKTCLLAAIEISGMDAGGIYLVDEMRGSVDLIVSQNLGDEFVKSVSQFPAGSPNALMVMAGKPVYLQYKKTGIIHIPVQEQEGLKAIAVIPVISLGRVVGCINITSHIFDEIPADAHVGLETIATQIGAAIKRIRADEALAQSEQKYRNVVEDQTEFISRFLPDGTHVFVNEAYCRYFGKTPGEIIGTRFVPPVPAEDKEKVQQHFRQLTRQNPVATIEHRIIMPDGQVRWQQWSDRAIFDDQGNLVEYQSVGRDITDRKKAEDGLNTAYEQITAAEEELREQYDEQKKSGDALRESEERYRSLVETISDWVWEVDENGVYTYVSPRVHDLIGYTPGEVLGKTPFDVMPHDEAVRVGEIFSTIAALQKPFSSLENTNIHKDGRIVILETSGVPVFHRNGQFCGYRGIDRDITARKEAEREIRESHTRLGEIVQGSPIPQFVIDKNHQVISWNKALEEYSGVKARDVIGTTDTWKAFYEKKRPVLADLLVDNTIDKIPELYTGKSGRSKYVEGAYEATDFFPRMGESGIWLYFTASTIRDTEGNIIGAVETLQDITERKKAEVELRASCEQIAASEEELRHQYDELKKSEDALRESEEKYRSILENIQDVYYRSDSAGNIILVSPSVVQLSGYDSVSELIGKNIAQSLYYNPEERSKLLDELTSRGSVTDYEVTLKKRDGTLVLVSTNSHKYYDKNGNFLGVEGIFRDITERKKIEASLKANEEKYRSLVDNLNVGIYRTTAEFPDSWLWANPALVRILGYDSLHECMEHPVTDIYANPEERKKFIRVLETDGFVRDYELQLKKKDGTHIWVSVTAQAKKNPEGTIAWIDGICDDITALKDAEEKARRYQLEMSRAIDYLPDATFIIDRKGTVIAWNRAIEEMTGVSAKDIIGRGDYEYALPFYRQRRPILIDLIFASEDELKKGDYVDIKRTGEILSVETPNPMLKGKPAVVRAIAAPVYDESGNVAGAIETITDITELKRAQEDLRESENRYRTIFENTGTATVLVEENTIISIANAEFVRLSGYPREETEGKKRWTEFVVKEDLERMLAQHRLRREKHETALRHYEFRFVTKTGEIRNIFLTIDVIPGTKQSVASLMDITAKVRAQDAVTLANKKLKLLNNITRHDILNQLTSLFGFLELVRQRLDDPVAISYLERQKEAAGTIKAQIEFTRDYQEVGVHSPEWQQVQGKIRNAVAGLAFKDIPLSVDTGDVEIFADLLLEKVFYTLAENAVRHGKTVTKIRFTTEETPDALNIICEDNGKGVVAEAKEQIFRREYFQNTGFGLFLTREILGITGITIRETGEPGKGARFEITVPKGAYRFASKT